MRKYLLPVAGVLAWGVGLMALSGFDAVEADRDGEVPGIQADAAQQNITMVEAELDARHAELSKQER
jgi:hypothetical protein